jgi:hypothetical protein
MAEAARKPPALSRGVQRVYICDCLIALYPIRKILAKSDINLHSMGVDIKSYQVNAHFARARGFGNRLHEGFELLMIHVENRQTSNRYKSYHKENICDAKETQDGKDFLYQAVAIDYC